MIAAVIIFVLADLLVVVVFGAVYGKKWSYKDGALMGVHIPDYAMKEPEIAALMSAYHKKSKIFYLCNLLVSAAAGFLMLWYISVFMILWTVWLIEFTAGAMFLLYGTHRKLYDIKMEHGWSGGDGKIVVIDTKVNTADSKLPYSVWWHLPVLAVGILLFFLPWGRAICVKFPEMWIFFGIMEGASLLFMGLNISTDRVRNKVYSGNTDTNLLVNRLEKRVYSIIWLVSDYLNMAATVIFVVMAVKQQWLVGWGLFIYIAIQTFTGMTVLVGLFYLTYKRREILDNDTRPLYADNDIYWKNGWYSNPNDKNLFVQDWTCESNFTTNMAKPAGKILTFGSLGVIAPLLLVLCIVFLKLDFTPVHMSVLENSAEISAPMYSLEFKLSKIQAVKLLQDIPDDSFDRSNGMADNRQAIGKFQGKKTGPCRMYVYKGYSPVLEIKLPQYTVFINSKDAKNVANWYHELAKR